MKRKMLVLLIVISLLCLSGCCSSMDKASDSMNNLSESINGITKILPIVLAVVGGGFLLLFISSIVKSASKTKAAKLEMKNTALQNVMQERAEEKADFEEKARMNKFK